MKKKLGAERRAAEAILKLKQTVMEVIACEPATHADDLKPF